MSACVASTSQSPVAAASSSCSPAAKRRAMKSRKSTSGATDKYYGQRDLAEFCEFIVTDLFGSTADAPASAPSSQASTPNIKEPPALVLFIAYALYRTRLPVSIVHHALYLLNRLKSRYPSARGTSSSPHRLFLSALMLSSKIQMDDTYSNRSWAVVGGSFFALREVNQMERELFGFLEWNAAVTKGELDAYTEKIESQWHYFRSMPHLSASQSMPSLPRAVDQTIGKRRRSDTTYTEEAIEIAQALRHKRAADAAIALLRPSSDSVARYKTTFADKISSTTSSSTSSSSIQSPHSDFFSYHSSSSCATSPENFSPISSPDESDLARFSSACSVDAKKI